MRFRLRISIALASATFAVLPSIGAQADPAVVVAASGRLTFLGSAQGGTIWQRISGIVSFGPAATVSSGGTVDASTGSGCLFAGTSFSNTTFVCAPFAPGEVILVLNSLEQGAGTLIVNTTGRTSGRVAAVVPFVEESPPAISPLSPLFWLPTLDYELGEDEVGASVRNFEATFFDTRAGYLRVGNEEAVLVDGSGIVVSDAEIAATLLP